MKEVLTLNQHEKLHRRNIDCLATLMEISGPENNNPEHPTIHIQNHPNFVSVFF